MQAPAQHAEDAIAREIERVVAREVDDRRLKALLATPGSFDKALWTLAVEQGWPGLGLPEDSGGLGLGWRDLAEVARVLGHATVSLPLIPATVVGRVLLAGKDNGEALGARARQLAAGEAMVCVALMAADDAGLPAEPALTLEDGSLTGVTGTTAFAAVADYALAWARKGGKPVLVLAELGRGVERETTNLVDNARGAAALVFDGARAVELEGGAPKDVLASAIVMTAFEQVGGAAACLELAKAYALEHRAFGQPIGAFQAIKHKMADIYTAIEIAKGCALEALGELEAGELSIAAAAAARISANRAYDFAAQEAIQVHGGMGITWEGFLHHHYRRARSLALELGSTAYWRNILLDELLAGGKS